jgi:mannose-6-phosphate isomerase-like protein (cupin superfamily)
MKFVVSKKQAAVTAEYGISKFYEYGLPFPDFSTGVSEIDGRYPKSGYEVDGNVDASWYVVSGSGELWIAGSTYPINPGDLVFVPKGEKYWIDGKNLTLVVTSFPAWHATQHTHVG